VPDELALRECLQSTTSRKRKRCPCKDKIKNPVSFPSKITGGNRGNSYSSIIEE
jgi:hypothetical protein